MRVEFVAEIPVVDPRGEMTTLRLEITRHEQRPNEQDVADEKAHRHPAVTLFRSWRHLGWDAQKVRAIEEAVRDYFG